MDALKTIKEIEKFFNYNKGDSCFEYDNQAHELSWVLDRLEFEKANHERFKKYYDSAIRLCKADVEKIITLQEGLLERFKMAYKDIIKIKKDLEEKVKNGCETYNSYEIAEIEWSFYLPDEYVIENWGSNGRYGCWSEYISDKVTHCIGRGIYWRADFSKETIKHSQVRYSTFENWADEYGLVHSSFKWNGNQEFPFGYEFKDVYLYGFMNAFFTRAHVLTLKDALSMDPDMLFWQVQVNIEARR